MSGCNLKLYPISIFTQIYRKQLNLKNSCPIAMLINTSAQNQFALHFVVGTLLFIATKHKLQICTSGILNIGISLINIPKATKTQCRRLHKCSCNLHLVYVFYSGILVILRLEGFCALSLCWCEIVARSQFKL